MTIRCITFDLDDTLWETGPVIERAEQIAHQWLATHAPRAVGGRTRDALLVDRRRHYATLPQHAHDFTALRRDWLRDLVCAAGYPAALGDDAFDVFWRARNDVAPFPHALELIEALRPHYVLGTITNGNADVHHIGLGAHFKFAVTAADAGVMKPDPAIFDYALTQAGVRADEAVHVGDDPRTDVHGAKRAGLRAVWINPDSSTWDPQLGPPPDATVTDVSGLRAVLRAWA